MAIGSLVAIPELSSEGIARLVGEKGQDSSIRFLASGALKTQPSRQVVRYALLPGTRVRIAAGVGVAAAPAAAVAATVPAAEGAAASRPATILAQPILRDAASGLLVYGVAYTDDAGGQAKLREDAIAAVEEPADQIERLATAAFHDLRPAHDPRLPADAWGPPTFSAREELLAWRDGAWSGTAGVVALAGARVRPLPHQLLTARRVLADRQVRYLLADEVGLGKTIEAGLVMQSLLAMQPKLRVLVVVPGALVSQWFLELFVKFGGRPFLMLDRERLRTHPGDPWKDEPFVIASNRALEELDGPGALRLARSRWDLLVVDECHRMQPQGILYKRVASLSKHTPHVLLLSATPARQHADAHLALLALLQPQSYRVDDAAGFAAKLAAHDKVVELMARTRDADAATLRKLPSQWTSLLGGDPVLAAKAAALADGGEAARESLLAHVREHHRLDYRMVRHRREVLARLSKATGVSGLGVAVRSVERVPFAPDAAEKKARTAVIAYRDAMLARFGGDAAALPPRLAHWLLQAELALGSHPRVLERMLAMRATVLADPSEFADYRSRAIANESLAHVLRSDLSENEIAAHIAVSAASHADDPDEEEPLAAARAAAVAWAAKPPARTRALIKRLHAFWEERPQEKVLIFTAHGLAVAPLEQALAAEFGDDAIETFGAHQDTVAREEAARRFRDEARCWAMVCDPLGGEGRNFQFVSAIAHHDLPWSIAGVEQRIGRVDRIGRDGDVPSWVFATDADDAVDAAWAEALERAVGVFGAPTSGLEFVTDAIETRALAAALAGGAPALRALIPDLSAAVAAERAGIDRRAEELFHEETSSFAEAARVSAAIGAAQPPVEAMARWLRGMGGSAKRDDEVPKRWHLRARHNDKPDHGTFDRELALSRPELAFFAVGNDLVDRALDDAAGATWCGAQAWRRKAAGTVTEWEGVRASFALAHDLAPLMAAQLRLESLRRLFLIAPPTRLLLCVRMDGTLETDPATLALLARGYSANAGDAPMSQSASRDAWVRPLAGGKVESVTAWQDGVRRAGRSAIEHATTRLPQARDAGLAALNTAFELSVAIARGQAATAEAALGASHADAIRAKADAEDEANQAGALRAALAGATYELAAIAYVVVR